MARVEKNQSARCQKSVKSVDTLVQCLRSTCAKQSLLYKVSHVEAALALWPLCKVKFNFYLNGKGVYIFLVYFSA